MTFDEKIEFTARDFIIKETNDGAEVVNLRGELAFDEQFIQMMKDRGVKKFKKQEPESEE